MAIGHDKRKEAIRKNLLRPRQTTPAPEIKPPEPTPTPEPVKKTGRKKKAKDDEE